MKLPMFVDEAECTACGGVCCKNIPGFTRPNDWGATEEERVERIAAALRSGDYCIDWWEGDPRPDGDFHTVDMIRPAHTRKRGQMRHASWGNDGPCALLTEAGCSLAHDARPFDCRGLVPNKDHQKCKPFDEGKKDSAIAWVAHQATIKRAEEMAEKQAPSSMFST